MNKKFLSLDELAVRWGFTRIAVRNIVKQGKIPAVRLNGHRFRVDIADIEAYETRAKQASAAALGVPVEEIVV